MPTYTLTQILRSNTDQKSFLESVTKELRWKGGRIINIKSEVGRAVDQTTFNVVTITYESPMPIKYHG
jgi:hypothetical protein